jgi:hypothetical protein
MQKFKKLIIAVMIATFGFGNLVWAADTGNNIGDSATVLPQASKDGDCTDLLNTFNTAMDNGQKVDGNAINGMLGCAIVTGRVSLPMVPYFIKYFSNYLLGIVSMIALLFTVIGGFLYTAGGLTEQKDKGKKYIGNALKGMVLAFLAWTIVNVILSAVTG